MIDTNKSCELTEAVGKTIQGVFWDREYRVLVVYTDGSFSQIEACDGNVYEEDYFNYRHYGELELLEAGVIDAAWIEQRKLEEFAREEKTRKEIEAHERAQYEKLKKKFEPS